MARLVVVKGDPVRGTDQHNVQGQATNPAPPPPTVPYVGVGAFDYVGTITDQVSDFVTVDDVPIALVTSRSTLDPGQTAPAGKHAGPQGTGFVPPAPQPVPASLTISDAPLGIGVPNAAAGSALLTVDGAKVLLDGDLIDTCSGIGAPAGSKVSARGQAYLTCTD
ncbi:hypothetical protein ACFFV7_36160 [Nonomuraea spiralis]|uniref:Uncharacterized protein n=1 Tax=Nonomuraea spiralis TaxID=46182 RepID=A0ABV5IQ47_9ACTN|nr:hypothetical protein [Nonomuraea spiralis]GGT11670.1 hypothetical protein GCM10010176_065470 [Nonomuraea spiralis]